MKPVYILVIALLSAVGVTADWVLKLSTQQEDPRFKWTFMAVGGVIYGLTALGWAYVMANVPLAQLGIVYSVSMILLLTGLGVYFGEIPTGREYLGMGMAIGAILLLARFN
jgi:drug/metabolite transporter (DMT)-like permease